MSKISKLSENDKHEENEKVSETRAATTEAAPGAPGAVFQAPGNLYSAILSRNEAVKDAKRLKDFLELRDKYVRKKVLFKDPLFPADDSSLYYSQKFPLNLVWKRPSVSGPHLLSHHTSRSRDHLTARY
ncbi:calpain-3b, partial [Tachysurus ichikawai]